jgi:hypothetical protein
VWPENTRDVKIERSIDLLVLDLIPKMGKLIKKLRGDKTAADSSMARPSTGATAAPPPWLQLSASLALSSACPCVYM